MVILKKDKYTISMVQKEHNKVDNRICSICSLVEEEVVEEETLESRLLRSNLLKKHSILLFKTVIMEKLLKSNTTGQDAAKNVTAKEAKMYKLAKHVKEEDKSYK